MSDKSGFCLFQFVVFCKNISCILWVLLVSVCLIVLLCSDILFGCAVSCAVCLLILLYFFLSIPFVCFWYVCVSPSFPFFPFLLALVSLFCSLLVTQSAATLLRSNQNDIERNRRKNRNCRCAKYVILDLVRFVTIAYPRVC